MRQNIPLGTTPYWWHTLQVSRAWRGACSGERRVSECKWGLGAQGVV